MHSNARRIISPAITLLALATLLSLVAAPAVNAQTAYLGLDTPRGTLTNSFAARDSFLAALSVSGTDDVESYATATLDPTLTFGSTGITAQTDVNSVSPYDTNTSVSGGRVLISRPGDDVFTLSQAVTAFGLFIVDANNIAPPYQTLTLRLENTTTNSSKDVSYTFSDFAASFNVLYFGVTDTDAFNKVTFLNSRDPNDALYFDDLTVGFVTVPEPSTIILFLVAGIPIVGIVRSRIKSQV